MRVLRPTRRIIYAVGVESCATRLPLLRSVPLGPTKLRLCLKALFLWAFRSAFGLAPQNAPRFSAVTRPEPWPRLAPSGVRRGARGLGLSPAPCAAAPVVFAAIRAAMLRRWIHLLALRRVSPRIRRTASLHVAQFGTRPLVPCLTFHKVRFSSQHLRSPTSRQRA